MAGNSNWEDGNLSFLDLISILSFVIGVENLALNQQQVSSLDEHLSRQDNDLLLKIINQNEELLQQNKILIDLLKEIKNEREN
jgi:succinate dehydrogenase flavin-adding protein (antitoxin of CptAB toxin-antitoxin module)